MNAKRLFVLALFFVLPQLSFAWPPEYPICDPSRLSRHVVCLDPVRRELIYYVKEEAPPAPTKRYVMIPPEDRPTNSAATEALLEKLKHLEAKVDKLKKDEHESSEKIKEPQEAPKVTKDDEDAKANAELQRKLDEANTEKERLEAEKKDLEKAKALAEQELADQRKPAAPEKKPIVEGKPKGSPGAEIKQPEESLRDRWFGWLRWNDRMKMIVFVIVALPLLVGAMLAYIWWQNRRSEAMNVRYRSNSDPQSETTSGKTAPVDVNPEPEPVHADAPSAGFEEVWVPEPQAAGKEFVYRKCLIGRPELRSLPAMSDSGSKAPFVIVIKPQLFSDTGPTKSVVAYYQEFWRDGIRPELPMSAILNERNRPVDEKTLEAFAKFWNREKFPVILFFRREGVGVSLVVVVERSAISGDWIVFYEKNSCPWKGRHRCNHAKRCVAQILEARRAA